MTGIIMDVPVFSLLLLLTVLVWLPPSSNALSSVTPPSPKLATSSNTNKRNFQYGGGRTPGQADMPSLRVDEDDNTSWSPRPLGATEARLTVVQVTDVYTLENFASLKTMLKETRQSLVDSKQEAAGSPSTSDDDPDSAPVDDASSKDIYVHKCYDDGVISMLTGDFLAPYLLSSVDRGKGMMNAIAATPVDYLTWGNHEADIDHRTVCRHVKTHSSKNKNNNNAHNKGITWINSNMKDHDAMEYQQDYEIVEIVSPDGHHKRRIGLVGLLSSDPALYSHFKAPGAFGGATVDDPWDTLREYEIMLKGPGYDCDMVLPLQHLYVPDDHKTCRDFDDIPVVLSGHDHHRVDEVISGTRLLKPGLDAIYATVLELVWDSIDQEAPTVRARFVKTSDWDPDPKLEEINEKAYACLAPLRDTELARVPPAFEPLSSVNSRGRVCSMGRFLCSLLKSSLNTSRRQRAHKVDAVLLMGGNIRGGTDYEKGSYFSLEALEAEIKPDESIALVQMPGWLLAKGISETHSGDPIPGWVQFDDGVQEKIFTDGTPPEVTHVNGLPIAHDITYRVATKISDITNGQSPSWTEFYTENPEALPPKGAYVNVYAELMSFFSRNLWRKIWVAITPAAIAAECGTEVGELDLDPDSLDELCGIDSDCLPEQRMSVLDVDNSGEVTVDNIHKALSEILNLSVDDTGMETSLAEFVHSFADADGDGVVTLEDLNSFCEEIPEMYENQKWRLAFPRTEKLL